MADKKKPTGDYKVGFARPPVEHQIKKGEIRNPNGRGKSGKTASTDISALLDEPIKVTAGGIERDMSPFEAGIRQLAKRAVDGHLPSILKFIRICEEYGVIAPPPATTGGGVITAPKDVSVHEWLNSVTEEVPIDEA